MGSVDYFPTICAVAGVTTPDKAVFDGLNQSSTCLGAMPQRPGPLYWEYGCTPQAYIYPKTPADRSPNVAVRDGDWKLLLNADGRNRQLYNLKTDPEETANVADKQQEVSTRLAKLA